MHIYGNWFNTDQTASVNLVLLVNGRPPTDSSDASNAIAFINCTQNPDYHQCCYQTLCISTSLMLRGFPFQSFTCYYLYINFSRTLYLSYIYTCMWYPWKHPFQLELDPGIICIPLLLVDSFGSVFAIPLAFESVPPHLPTTKLVSQVLVSQVVFIWRCHLLIALFMMLLMLSYNIYSHYSSQLFSP